MMKTEQSRRRQPNRVKSPQAMSTNRFIHRKILARLFLGWLFLSVTVGGSILWLEIKRAEQLVHALALKESAIFSGASAHNLEQLDTPSTVHLRLLAEQLVSQHFLIVELYDRNEQLKLEVVRQGQEVVEQFIDQYRHQFPKVDEFTHDLHFIRGQLWLVTLVPLRGEQDSPMGYFEGVYQVDPETFAALKQNLIRMLAFVTLGIFFTSLLMYPIVLTLNRGVIRLSGELLQGNLELMNVLGCAIAERDSETNHHNYRVTYYALRLGEAIGLPEENMRDLIAGAFLHDVGKIGIRDPILLKPEKLTVDEFEVMKTHVALGVEILNKSHWLTGARDVVEFHHEKYDGSGYLQGLKGDAIPLNARIFAIGDVFDALTSHRPYKDAWPAVDAITKLTKEGGSHFDPQLVTIFAKIAPSLHQEVNDLDESQLEAMLQRLVGEHFLNTAFKARKARYEVART
ncbi:MULTISPECIES: HD-GYP domain-containing protein [Methylomonas]|uniref:HD-GYP domain-containing protein n=1 Tax=Methylomonas TaxID=416 RepID=UPI0007C8AE49|nr:MULTISPECIES: HD-GYP domain-containing protein [Methylomonas]ANE56715.1 phosphohydrolase [Methylomonas sp. DH-1]WNB75922.1 HD-GYP domain-containing protein [Methylomonas koyamae]